MMLRLLLLRIDRAAKRGLDIAAAFIGIILLGPVIAATAVVVYRYLGSPVLFTQFRLGLGGRAFKIYKFRTMSVQRTASGELAPDCDRLTSLGKLLRAWSLDELPQLWNVLTGDMSLVGPRPLLAEYKSRYSPRQARRHEVRPGLTGWAQINGRNGLSWEQKFTLDVWYVDHRSIRLDLAIILRTVWHVATRRGISESGHATASPFLS